MFSITRHSILLGGSGLHVPPTVGVTGVWVSIAILPSAGLEPDLGVTPRRSRPIGSNSIYTRKSHKSITFWRFLTFLAISDSFNRNWKNRSNSIHTRKSHKIDHFLEILNISDRLWQFRAELKKSCKYLIFDQKLMVSVAGRKSRFDHYWWRYRWFMILPLCGDCCEGPGEQPGRTRLDEITWSGVVS